MKVTVIIPVYNGAATIAKAVSSVLDQSYKNWELIVVDGLSKDNTVPILHDIKSKTNNNKLTIISEKDKGVYDAMNKGIEAASGDWIYFLGSDDELSHSNILQDIFSINSYQEYEVVYGNVQFRDSKVIYNGEFNTPKLLLQNMPHQAMFFRRSLFTRFGLYNLKYPLLADYVFNLQLFGNKEVNFKYIDRVIAFYPETGMSTVQNDKVYKKDRTTLVKKYFGYLWYLYALVIVPVLNYTKSYNRTHTPN